MTKVLVIDTKTAKERMVSRREAAVFIKLLPRGRYLTRDMRAAEPGLVPALPPAGHVRQEPSAGQTSDPVKKKPGRPKKTDQQ